MVLYQLPSSNFKTAHIISTSIWTCNWAI